MTKPLCDLKEFFHLSGMLLLQLFAKTGANEHLLRIILDGRVLHPADEEILLKVIAYLRDAYGDTTRRLGPKAVVHPIRATALLVRAGHQPTTLALLSALLHDKQEDLPGKGTTPEAAAILEQNFHEMLHAIDPEQEWYLMERIEWLTRKTGQSYYTYIGHLLDHAQEVPEIVRVKLADRLDNTLDMRVDIEDPMAGVDFFQTIFQILFVNEYAGDVSQTPHPEPSAINGAKRLYQLFKNAVLLSLIRQKVPNMSDPTAEKLFRAVATASMKEAERTILHIFTYHEINVADQRELLMEVMNYAQHGGLQQVTHPKAPHQMDGLFADYFEDRDKKTRVRNLERLYPNKAKMVQIATAFIAIFLGFLNNKTYFLKGINEQGMSPIQGPDIAPISTRSP